MPHLVVLSFVTLTTGRKDDATHHRSSARNAHARLYCGSHSRSECKCCRLQQLSWSHARRRHLRHQPEGLPELHLEPTEFNRQPATICRLSDSDAHLRLRAHRADGCVSRVQELQARPEERGSSDGERVRAGASVLKLQARVSALKGAATFILS